MKDRILDFFTSRIVRIFGITLLSAALFWIVGEWRNAPPPTTKQPAPKLPLMDDGGKSLKESPVTEMAKHFTPWRSSPRPQPEPERKPEPLAEVKPAERLPKLIHEFEVVQKPAASEKPTKAEAPFIPFGSVIAARLVQPVLCGKQAVPVIAELLQPIRDKKGQIWIPRGTRIHGRLSSGNLPGRLESTGGWIFVLPGSKLLETKASLQDRDFDPARKIYGVNDGTAGIVGTEIKTGGWKNGKVAKAGLAIAADASQDRMRTALGEVELGSARNAVLRGVSSLVNGVVPKDENSTESIVSVPAGKEFYLYIEGRREGQATPGAGEVETILRERQRLIEQLRQQTGKERP